MAHRESPDLRCPCEEFILLDLKQYSPQLPAKWLDTVKFWWELPQDESKSFIFRLTHMSKLSIRNVVVVARIPSAELARRLVRLLVQKFPATTGALPDKNIEERFQI